MELVKDHILVVLIFVFVVSLVFYKWFYLKEITFFGIFTFGKKSGNDGDTGSGDEQSTISRNLLFGKNRIITDSPVEEVNKNKLIGENEINIERH